jgi:hypothetical protein
MLASMFASAGSSSTISTTAGGRPGMTMGVAGEGTAGWASTLVRGWRANRRWLALNRDDRDFDDETRALARLTLGPDRAIVLLHDPEAHRQAEAHTLADVAGGKEGIEDTRQDVGRDTRAIVDDLQANPPVSLWSGAGPAGSRGRDDAGPQHQGAATVAGDHRLFGVADQVDQHLLETVRIAAGDGQMLGQVEANGDILGAELVATQVKHVLNDLVEVKRAVLGGALPGKGEQVLDDSATTLGRFGDGVQLVTNVQVEIRVVLQHLAVTDDHG